jgi:isopentenyl-diphosphate delta-isomerase
MTGDDTTPNGREALLVELVDERGAAIGSCTVAEAHRLPGKRHRAFSVLLFDDAGRVILQQRAAVKTRFASRWSNTCCGHPAPGEAVTDAAAKRLMDELGITADLTEVGVYRYQAADEQQVEYEWDHVLVGTVESATPDPDPAEVSDWAWVYPDELDADISANPSRYTPWLAGVLDVAVTAREQ